MTLDEKLKDFADANKMFGKGALSVALVITRRAIERGLPLKPEDLRTEGKGQVLRLGRGPVQAILKDYGVSRVLAEEGGRTSRGNMGKMEAYVKFLNAQSSSSLGQIERWWVARVMDYFASKPLVLKLDQSRALKSIIRDLLAQAAARQRQAPGTMFLGAMLQHLVGAKLDIVIGGVEHQGASVADAASGKPADFRIGDTAIHVTTAPGEALIRKCLRNIESSLRPLIITVSNAVVVAEELAKQANIAERIDVLDAEQFIVGNLFEHGRFDPKGRIDSARAILERYNEVVSRHETDPSLRIELADDAR